MLGVEDELEKLDQVLIASENWSQLYSKTPDIHAKVIKAEAKLLRQCRGFFNDIASKAASFIDKDEYEKALEIAKAAKKADRLAVTAANVNVIITDDPLDDSAGAFINLTLKTVTVATALGAQSGQELYQKLQSMSTLDDAIKDVALNQVAGLVGMKVTDDGIVPNPNAKYNILDTVRDDIRSSIQTSIDNGEDIASASDRLQDVISDPERSTLIAQTETVNSFGAGLDKYGEESDAVGHEWEDVGADDVCSDNTDLGPIPFDQNFEDSNGDDIRGPTAHPRCRCNKRLIYQNELDANPDLFD